MITNEKRKELREKRKIRTTLKKRGTRLSGRKLRCSSYFNSVSDYKCFVDDFLKSFYIVKYIT